MTGTPNAENTTASLVAAAPPVKPATIREFERALKSLGYSQRESTAIAKGGFKAIGNAEPDPDLSQLAAVIAKNISLLKEST